MNKLRLIRFVGGENLVMRYQAMFNYVEKLRRLCATVGGTAKRQTSQRMRGMARPVAPKTGV